MVAFIGVLTLIVTLIIGIPLPFAFACAFMWLTVGYGYTPDFLLAAGYGQLNSVVLLAIPLFILAGGIMEKECAHLRGIRCNFRFRCGDTFLHRFDDGTKTYRSRLSEGIYGSIAGSSLPAGSFDSTVFGTDSVCMVKRTIRTCMFLIDNCTGNYFSNSSECSKLFLHEKNGYCGRT